MEMADQEGACKLITSPEEELVCNVKKISLASKSHELVNRNGIIDKRSERTCNEVLPNEGEHLANCCSNDRCRDESIPSNLQPECGESSIICNSNKCGSDICTTATVDSIEHNTKEPTGADPSQISKVSLVKEIENSLHEGNKNTEIDSNLFSKMIIKDNEQEHEISFVQYKSEDQLPDLVALITVDLSEPYSVYTYRYFLHNWPHLSHLAYHGDQCVGAIVCKLDIHRKNVLRGYIAMLVVHKSYRRWKIGSSLVRKAVRKMIDHGCEEVVLETEVTNKAALRLYENLGFVRDKRLLRYYLNGVDAWRLKLWLK